MIGFAKAEAALRGGAKVMVTHSDEAQGGGILVDQRTDAAPVGAQEAGLRAGAGTGRAFRCRLGADAAMAGVA